MKVYLMEKKHGEKLHGRYICFSDSFHWIKLTKKQFIECRKQFESTIVLKSPGTNDLFPTWIYECY